MSAKEIKAMFSDPLFKKVEYIINTGGEATVRRDLVDVLLAEHEVLPRATIQISTNGLLPNRVLKCSEALLAKGAKVDVGISLDGIGEAHDRIRGIHFNFELVNYLILRLKPLMKKYQKQFSVGTGSTLTDLILENYPSVMKYAEFHGLPFMFHWYNESPFYDNPGMNLDTKRELFIKALDSISRRKDLYLETWKKRLRGELVSFRCFALHTFLVIHPNGDIAPCLTYYDEKVGNALKSPPSEIWKGTVMMAERFKIAHCSACLNNWAWNWSMRSWYWPIPMFALKRRLGLA